MTNPGWYGARDPFTVRIAQLLSISPSITIRVLIARTLVPQLDTDVHQGKLIAMAHVNMTKWQL